MGSTTIIFTETGAERAKEGLCEQSRAIGNAGPDNPPQLNPLFMRSGEPGRSPGEGYPHGRDAVTQFTPGPTSRRATDHTLLSQAQQRLTMAILMDLDD
jgi:hypothetical protein